MTFACIKTQNKVDPASAPTLQGQVVNLEPTTNPSVRRVNTPVNKEATFVRPPAPPLAEVSPTTERHSPLTWRALHDALCGRLGTLEGYNLAPNQRRVVPPPAPRGGVQTRSPCLRATMAAHLVSPSIEGER